MLMYIDYRKESIKMLLELTIEHDKVTGYKFNIQRPILCFISERKYLKVKLKTIPFTTAP